MMLVCRKYDTVSSTEIDIASSIATAKMYHVHMYCNVSETELDISNHQESRTDDRNYMDPSSLSSMRL